MAEENVRYRGGRIENGVTNNHPGSSVDGDSPRISAGVSREVIEAPNWPTGLEGKQWDYGMSMSGRIFHWGTLIAISIVLVIGITTTYVHLQWWPLTDIKAFLHLSLFLSFNYLTLTNLCQAAYIGPGYIPLHWKPVLQEDELHLQYCNVCEGFKAPRSHHCSRCGRCVLKMDHHCPWINNCVGHRNHAYFVRFLAAAVVGCIHAVYICASALYYAFYRFWFLRFGTGDEPEVILTLNSFLATFFAFGLALGVIVSVGFLLGVQLRVICRNQTGVEDYISNKAESYTRRFPFVYPYNLGWRRNMREVLGTWDGLPKVDGIWWPIVAPTTQFTFSEEQLYQKWLKRENAREYAIVRDFPGGVCASIRYGVAIFCCQPWNDETRVRVEKGEHWFITRGNKRWLYGRKKVEKEPQAPADMRSIPRGWFPRICAQRL